MSKLDERTTVAVMVRIPRKFANFVEEIAEGKFPVGTIYRRCLEYGIASLIDYAFPDMTMLNQDVEETIIECYEKFKEVCNTLSPYVGEQIEGQE